MTPTYARRSTKPSKARERMFVLDTPARVRALLWPRMRDATQESFWVIAIDVRNRVIDVVEVAKGTLTGVEVHPREVFRAALRLGAAGIVVCHNHPSGDPSPSLEDFALTRRLLACGRLLGIPVIDHVVLAEQGYRSIAEVLGTDYEEK